MDALIALYQSQPFWIWLAFGVLILAVEIAAGTEWLLWPAVSAGVVAVLTAIGLRLGFGVEVAIFAALTLVTTLASRKLLKRVNPGEADINDRNTRLVGQRARVTEAFVNGRGRVFISGSDWLAEIEGDAPPVGDSVVVEAVAGSKLKVRTA